MNTWRRSLPALSTRADKAINSNLNFNLDSTAGRYCTQRQSHTSSTPYIILPPPSRRESRPQRSQQQRLPPSLATMAPWSAALTRYAQTPDPSRLPSTEVLHWDDQTITIHDGFEKAKYHFLVLPRIPFLRRTSTADDPAGAAKQGATTDQDDSAKTPPPPQLQSVGGKLTFGATVSSTKTKGVKVPYNHLASLSDLLRSPFAPEVLDAMTVAAEKVRYDRYEYIALPALPASPIVP